MDLEKEAREARRRRREAIREKHQAEQRALIIRLILVGVLLAISAVVIVVISLAGRSQPPATTPNTTVSTPDTTIPTPDATAHTGQDGETNPNADPSQSTGSTTVIHFAAAGDLNITDQVIASGGTMENFAPAFVDVLPILADADLTALNLEGNFIGAPYGTGSRSAPQNLLTALKNAGVDLIQTANSYSIYNGVAGLGTTLDAIEAAGLESVGAYATREDFRRSGGYTLRIVKGIRVAIVAFTKGMDSMGLPAGSEDCVNVLYKDYDSTYQKVDTEGIKDILEAASEENPDIIIALVHWGSEFNDKISPTQQSIEKLLLSNGVDAIIGTHSHFVQQMKLNEDGTFVAYSLGDFFGDAQRAGTEYSVILDLEITKDHESGETKITGYTTTPIFTVHEEGEPLRVLRIREAMKAYEDSYVDRVSKETYDDMVYALKRIEKRLAGE
jgi:poly-gamma-glutamate synthesis protein (capsule biosynthesis protein)